MTIPDYQSLMRPVLEAAEKGEVRISDVVARVSDELALSDTERATLLPSGRQSIIANRIHWAKTYLKHAGLVEQTRWGRFQLTERGRDALGRGPQRIDNAFLAQFEEFRAFQKRSRSEVVNGAANSIPDLTAIDETPEAILREAHRRLHGELREDLLERITAQPADFFERLIVELLMAMGYGGTVTNSGRVVGRSGDGGIDGVIDQDQLGLDRVYVQAKRYARDNKVPAAAIRDFFGSLDRYKAAKGVFVTTSDFTPDAKETASMMSKRIVLINGSKLGDLMIRHNVGCRIEETLYLKKLDEDFFQD